MDQRATSLIKTYERLVAQRQPLEKHWDDCFRHSYPLRGGFLAKDSDGYAAAQQAARETAERLSSVVTDSVRLLASSVLGALTPSNQQWFSLAIPGVASDSIQYDAKQWLETSSKVMFEQVHRVSNYDSVALEFFVDEMVGGMAGLYVEKRDGRLYFEAWPLKSLYCADSLGSGYIDTIYRRVLFTASELVARFGFANLPEPIQRSYNDDPYDTKQHEVIHAIRPRLSKNGKQVKGGKLNKNLPWESIYVLKASGSVINESGFHEMPVIVPRWSCIPDTDYAVGPMYDALPDAKTLNSVTQFMMQNAELAIAGTFVAKDDGVISTSSLKIGPRKIIFAADTDSIKPLATGGNIQFAINEIARLEGQIRRVLLADQLGPTDKQIMTATEVASRTNLIQQILGPIFGRLQAEFLLPLITRIFGLLLRDGDLGTPPESLSGISATVTYSSPLANAQKLKQLQAMDQFEQRLATKAQAATEILDLYDIEAATRLQAELLGVPVSTIRDAKAVDKIRRQKAEAQAQLAATQAAQEAQAATPPPTEQQKLEPAL
ncbi:portal protein [Uliginosibacterium sp. 31-16]|uniref:portal protein n=1 Tax=Uliginosibacterium sp. 31-16 TaxID=3068315 RepID=UPI00273E6C26|nr:portal protein [Uliginosibacterium sp. 31-16]MDP5239922.1 portal protein [Uliginosibacterium sp. 31-16]